jgi:hypothetical protein
LNGRYCALELEAIACKLLGTEWWPTSP